MMARFVQKQVVKGVAIYHNIAIIKMPPVEVVFFRDEKGRCQVLEWLKLLPEPASIKGGARMNSLAELGHEIRRPFADYLRDGIYELRWRHRSVNYRILYFFHGRGAVVLTSGFTKEDKVPVQEIGRAVEKKLLFEANPFRYGYMGE